LLRSASTTQRFVLFLFDICPLHLFSSFYVKFRQMSNSNFIFLHRIIFAGIAR
jgi:hypothetical protein